ncbi:MAG: TetR/AcrR family transcriptional regulator [Deltaproteobacteria bacterium]|nr:TetR/AcrR family transcriptional regulator [Deltaproteobacteria bacterium]
MDKTDRLNQIFDESLKVFARFGYKKATVEDIARQAGMTKGNLYLYVKNKRDMYEKTTAHALLRWQTKVSEDVAQQHDVEAMFVTMCTKAFEYLAQDNDLRTVLMNDPAIFPLSPREDSFNEINQASMNMLKDILQKGIDQGRFRKIDIGHATEFLFSIYVMFIIKTYVKSEGKSTRKMFEEGVQLVLNGLLSHGNEPDQR